MDRYELAPSQVAMMGEDELRKSFRLLIAEVESLRHELQQAKEAISHLEKGKPLGELVGKQTVVNMAREISVLKEQLATRDKDHDEIMRLAKQAVDIRDERIKELEAQQ